MAIMWDPPQVPAGKPSPAEVAWRLWLVQALTAAGTDDASLGAALVRSEGSAATCAAADRPRADA